MPQDPLLSNFVDIMFGVEFLAYANKEVDNIKKDWRQSFEKSHLCFWSDLKHLANK